MIPFARLWCPSPDRNVPRKCVKKKITPIHPFLPFKFLRNANSVCIGRTPTGKVVLPELMVGHDKFIQMMKHTVFNRSPNNLPCQPVNNVRMTNRRPQQMVCQTLPPSTTKIHLSDCDSHTIIYVPAIVMTNKQDQCVSRRCVTPLGSSYLNLSVICKYASIPIRSVLIAFSVEIDICVEFLHNFSPLLRVI